MSKVKPYQIAVFFIFIMLVSLLFDNKMESDVQSISLVKKVLQENTETVQDIPLDREQLISIGGSTDTEVVSVIMEQSHFEGVSRLDLSIVTGALRVWYNNNSYDLSELSDDCRKIQTGYQCSLLLRGLKHQSPIIISSSSGLLQIRDIQLKNVVQHQLLWPTNISVIVLIFLFVPVAFTIGFIRDKQIYNIAALASSLMFIGILSIGLLVFLLVFLLISYVLLHQFCVQRKSLVLYVMFLVLSIIVIKLIWPLIGISLDLPVNWLLLPIGFSYLVARQIDFAIKLKTRQTEIISFPLFLTYNLFWPSFAAGPITQITQIHFPDEKLSAYTDRVQGGLLLGVGLIKKSIADLAFAYLVLGQYSNVMEQETTESYKVLAFFFGNMLFVYFDFSGYTDMARGIAKLMGVNLPENFNNPLMKPNMRLFWQNWHMSLTQWVGRSVFMPISFSIRREHKIIVYIVPVIATTFTIGLGHGLNFVWVLWALHHALGIFITDLFLKTAAVIKNYSVSAGEKISMLGTRFGFLFVWAWLMLSYSFTLTTNPVIALENYFRLLIMPFSIFY